jgi:hypothetical protein
MRSLFTLLIQLSGKAWAAVVVAVLSGGAITVFYFSSVNAASNSGAVNRPAWGRVEHTGRLRGGHGPDHHSGLVPAVPEANAGLVLIPVVAAMLLFSSRRLWLVKPTSAADGQKAPGRD